MSYSVYFTDGSVRRDQNLMSYAWISVEEDVILDADLEILPGNNSAEAEVKAILLALEHMYGIYTQDPEVIFVLVTDCEYCVRSIHFWLEGWIRQERKVKFYDDWVKIYNILKEMPVYFFWVRGHDGTEYNEMVDEFCKDGLKAYIDEYIFNRRSDKRSDNTGN